MKILSTLSLLLFLPLMINSQNCESTSQKEFLHANNVRAMILNGGDNFWDLNDSEFRVPYTGLESPSTIFATGLWLAAKDEMGELRLSQVDYRNTSSCGYESGPVFQEPSRPSNTDYENWDKIFSVHQLDILLHKKDFEDGDIDDPIEAIYGWPGLGNKHFETIHGFPLELSIAGAGFHELPGSVNGIYEPELGEFPHIEGMNPEVTPGEIKWCVYNNKTKSNGSFRTEPLGLEIQQTMYAMSCPDEALSNAVFQRYTIINKSGLDYSDVKMGQWMDPDLGCYTDDYIGCDPASNSAYVYNEDNVDGTTGNTCNGRVPTYEHPPVSTLTFLNASMDKYGSYINSALGGFPPTADPVTMAEFYNLMSGLWRDGTPWTYGGTGYNIGSTDTVDHLFPDIPTDVGGWSMAQSGLDVGDRRFVATTGRSSLEDQQVWTIDLVYGYYNDEVSNAWDMVSGALDNVSSLQASYDSGFMDCTSELCGCECVWPGDADQSGRVDYLDYIPIIRALNEVGIERPNGMAWKGYQVDDWDYDLPTGINAKRADTNGDGRIGEDDLEIMEAYLNLQNACYSERKVTCPNGDDIFFTTNNADTLLATRAIKNMWINLDSDEEFEGITFEVRYDEDIFDLMLFKPRLTLTDTAKVYNYWNFRQEGSEGICEVAQMSSTRQNDGIDRSGISNIVLIGNTDPATYPTPYAELKVCNAVMHFADGSTRVLKSQSFKYWFQNTIVTGVNSPKSEVDFGLYPNPVAHMVNLQLPGSGWTIDVVNALGRVSQSVFTNEEKIQLPTDALPSGTYYVRISALDGRSGVKKMIILR